MSLPSLPALALSVLILCAAQAPPAAAQCAPDGLDGGPCCAPTGALLPQFPAMQPDAVFICFDVCQPALKAPYCVNMGVPVPMQFAGLPVCGAYSIRIRLKDCVTNTFVWTGGVNAFYSRNWQESSVAGAINLTVWRFVVSGDLAPLPALPVTPCDRPPCSAQYIRTYFTGYIDYVFDCLTGGWQVAFVLNHECDDVHHAPGTQRPAPAGGFHPTRSYSIVAPGSTFAISSTTPLFSDGPITAEAMRWNDFVGTPGLCSFEERANGVFQAANELCICAATGPNQYVATLVNAFGGCGSSVGPSPLGPLLQKKIGNWTNPGTYPGVEFALFDFGWLEQKNGCNGTSTQQWFEGGETLRGFPAFDFAGNLLDPEFEDLGSSRASFPNPAPKIGAPHVCEHILNFNLP